VEHNLIVARRAVLRTAANVGPHTQAETFAFRENYWFCSDRPEASRPVLMVAEEKGVYGVDPDVTLNEGIPAAPGREPARLFGADATAWKSPRPEGGE
jgi:hypothetical protein